MSGRRRAVERARSNAERARRKILAQRRKLRAVRRSNQERTEQGPDGTRYSPGGGETTAATTAGRHSSVPATDPTGTGVERLYGRRLDDHASQD